MRTKRGCIFSLFLSCLAGGGFATAYTSYAKTQRFCAPFGISETAALFDGKAEDDVITMGAGSGTALGGAGNDVLSDTDSKQHHQFLSVLTGGTGTDSFILHAGNTTYSRITDFDPKTEKIIIAYPEGTAEPQHGDLKAVLFQDPDTGLPAVELVLSGAASRLECLAVFDGALDRGSILASISEIVAY